VSKLSSIDSPPHETQLHPVARDWVTRSFGQLTDAQERCLPHVLAGRSVILSAPTGAGKTLAGFLGILDRMLCRFDLGQPVEGVNTIYLSPLRALAYDIEKNLMAPLRGLGLEENIRVGVRTGDTSQTERQRQKKRPPHLLLTTPESLAILLCLPAWQESLARCEVVIVDELHAFSQNQRGTHLSLSLERLEALRRKARRPPLTRVGLSATASPLRELGRFLCGRNRNFAVEEAASARESRVEVFSPLRRQPYPPAGFTGARLMEELAELIASRRSVLVFCNTRGSAESICLRLKEALPKLADRIEAHHSSLDRHLRFDIEDRLKRGELRAVVCSTSLELGVDIGAVDLVAMVSTPKGVSRAVQRIGRSGHSIHQTSHGVLVATNVNDLVECMVTADLVRRGQLDPVRPPELGFDVLAQHLVGMAVASEPKVEQAFRLCRRAWPFRELTRADFDRVLEYLQGGGRSLAKQYREVFGKIIIDERGRLIAASRKVVRDYLVNVGTIPSEGMVVVRLGRKRLGEVEESFLKRIRIGDLFVLGGRVVRLQKFGAMEAKVSAADGRLPTVPRWNANKMPLTSGVAEEVARLRGRLDGLLENGERSRALEQLVEQYEVSLVNAEAVVRHFETQRALSVIPTPDRIVMESYPDQHEELIHLFFHTLIGRSANDALSRIVAWRSSRQGWGNALVTIDDYGFLLTLPPGAPDRAEAWAPLFLAEEAERHLAESLKESELVRWQFRGVAQTGLMVPRNLPGAERKKQQLQWSSEILFQVLIQHEPDHPLLEEAYRQATHAFLDFPRARRFMEQAGTVSWVSRQVPCVSPLGFGMFASKIKEGMMHESAEEALDRIFVQLSHQLPSLEEQAES